MGLTELKARVAELADLGGALDLLHWDMETYMPAGGLADRASQVALLGRIAHERFVADEVGAWLEEAAAEVKGLDPSADDVRAVQVLRRDYDRERKVPTEWVERFAKIASLSQHAWRDARAGKGFAHFRPHLEQVLEARREYAGFFAPWNSIYDPLLDDFEPGTTTVDVERLFAGVRPELTALVGEIRSRGRAVDGSFLEGDFDEAQQTGFGMEVLRRMGFDFDRGRQDRSAHPFTTAFSRNDVRITTRFDPRYLPPALFGSMHEGGHALYEQGIAAEYARAPLGRYASLGIHESQSRLWENIVGRSRAFWKRFYPDLQRRFPSLASVPLESFYRAINRVSPSLIRVEADEVTYNLHIMMRFDLELALLRGTLVVAELPGAWREASLSALGVAPPDDANGVLQDIHWSGGAFAYFPTYTIGNLAAVQLYEAAVAASPGIPADIERGEFGALLGWLRENVHRHGRKYEPNELLRRATGRPLEAAPYLRYLRTKYADVYDLG